MTGHGFRAIASTLLNESGFRPDVIELKPKVVVCLGATAAQALLGKDFRVSQRRGEFVESDLAEHVTATVHPSSILRAPDEETRRSEMKRFVEDLKKVAKVI